MIGEFLELRQLLKSYRLSPDELKEQQNRKLRRVIRHSYDNVPYYHSLFKSAGLSPEDVHTVEALKYVPITTKDDLRAAGIETAIAKGINVSSCLAFNTSGSTGKPFTTYCTREEARTRRLVQFRMLLSLGFRPRDRLVVLGIPNRHRTRFHQHLGFYRSENISYFLPIEEQIRCLRRMNPTVLWVFPTVLRALLHEIDYRLSKLCRPSVLITMGEVFDQVMKERVRLDLDTEFFNLYGSMEVGQIASECRAHEGLHVNMDHVILECLEGDLPANSEAPGLAVVTTLNAFAMPFIRYRLEDIFTRIEKPCSCGSHFTLIGPPMGREWELIKLPSGKVRSPAGFDNILKGLDGIDQYRFIQESPGHLVIQLAFQRNPKEEQLLKTRSRLMEYLGEPVRLDMHKVEFLMEEKLKFRTFISKLPVSGA